MIGPGLYLAVGILVGTVLVGMLLKWIIENFMTDREASIAAFSIVLGNVLGSALLFAQTYEFGIETLGSIGGLALLWWTLFKRKSPTGVAAE